MCCCRILYRDGVTSTCRSSEEPLANQAGSAEQKRHVGVFLVVVAKLNAVSGEDVVEYGSCRLTYNLSIVDRGRVGKAFGQDVVYRPRFGFSRMMLDLWVVIRDVFRIRASQGAAYAGCIYSSLVRGNAGHGWAVHLCLSIRTQMSCHESQHLTSPGSLTQTNLWGSPTRSRVASSCPSTADVPCCWTRTPSLPAAHVEQSCTSYNLTWRP